MKSGKWQGRERLEPSPRSIAFKIVLLAFLWIAGNFRLTDADLVDEEVVGGNRATATTLDLGADSSVNHQPVTLFFQTVGLVAGGFDVRSLRLKKGGKENFKYLVSYEQIGGTSEACRQLVLTWWDRNGGKKWQGQVDQIAYQAAMAEEGFEDVIMLLERKNNPAGGGSCQFDLVFKTIRPNQGASGGLRDEERLTNLITLSN